MKMGPRAPGKSPIISEGKRLEVTPVIRDCMGSLMMLPPTVWPVENWVLGYQDDHYVGSPYQLWANFWTDIPGSSSQSGHQLSFIIRVLEDGEQPTHSPSPFTSEQVAQLVAEFNTAFKAEATRETKK